MAIRGDILLPFRAGAMVRTAQALQIDYCAPNRSTPAHGWCFQGNAHYWDWNYAYYFGGGGFRICAAIRGWYSKETINKRCGYVSNTPPQAWVGYCNNGSAVEAGVGNEDGAAHNIYGRAIADNSLC
jgi:hypothetical protein